jgi:hypothetical protein
MRLQLSIVLFTTVLAVVPAFAAETGLDARANPDHPSIRTEILRAHTAAGAGSSLMQKGSRGTNTATLAVYAFLNTTVSPQCFWQDIAGGASILARFSAI